MPTTPTAATYRYSEYLSAQRVGEVHDYTFEVILAGSTIATVRVARATLRTHRYGVTMTDGSTLPRTFPSVKAAAEAAATAEANR